MEVYLTQEEIDNLIIDIHLLETDIEKHQTEIKNLITKLEFMKMKLYNNCKHEKTIDYTQYNERTTYYCSKCMIIL